MQAILSTADSHHAVGECHYEGASHVEKAVNCNCLASAIVQHHCTAQEGAKEGPHFGRPHNQFLLLLTELELIPNVEQSTTYEAKVIPAVCQRLVHALPFLLAPANKQKTSSVAYPYRKPPSAAKKPIFSSMAGARGRSRLHLMTPRPATRRNVYTLLLNGGNTKRELDDSSAKPGARCLSCSQTYNMIRRGTEDYRVSVDHTQLSDLLVCTSEKASRRWKRKNNLANQLVCKGLLRSATPRSVSFNRFRSM